MIPPEITDAIIDHLHADVPMLIKSSLICRRWLPSARHHLYRVICLHSSNIQRFIALRASPLCSIAQHVRNITLRDLDDTTVTSPPTNKIEWPLALRDLPFARVLVLSGFQWEMFGLNSLESYLPKIKELSVTAMSFKSLSDIKQLIGGFPNLQRLRVQNTGWEANDEGLDSDFSTFCKPSKQLIFVRLGECYKRDILDWLISQPDHQPQHLDLSVVASADVPAIGRYIRRISPSLRHLVFGFADMDPGGDAEDFHREVDLAQLIYLRTLVVDPLIYGSDIIYQLSSAVEFIPSILAKIHAPHLEVLQFNIYIDEERQLDEIPWKGYDALIGESRQFAQLRYLLFHIDEAYSDGIKDIRASLWNKIRDKLPECNGRGVLEFI